MSMRARVEGEKRCNGGWAENGITYKLSWPTVNDAHESTMVNSAVLLFIFTTGNKRMLVTAREGIQSWREWSRTGGVDGYKSAEVSWWVWVGWVAIVVGKVAVGSSVSSEVVLVVVVVVYEEAERSMMIKREKKKKKKKKKKKTMVINGRTGWQIKQVYLQPKTHEDFSFALYCEMLLRPWASETKRRERAGGWSACVRAAYIPYLYTPTHLVSNVSR
jgi:hypothetical protein